MQSVPPGWDRRHQLLEGAYGAVHVVEIVMLNIGPSAASERRAAHNLAADVLFVRDTEFILVTAPTCSARQTAVV